MMFSPDGLSCLVRCLVFVSALAGPERNRSQPIIPVQQKVHALTCLAQTGQARDCDALLKTIRTYKTEAELTLPKYVKARKELEDGIRNDQELLKREKDKEIRASRQSTLDSHKSTLATCREREADFRYLIATRAKEEKAFAQAYRMIQEIRRGRKAP